eukprot:scaffold18297_cov132-Isochrysis_galbana.AAC.1
MPTHDGRLSLDVHPIFAGGGGARRMCSCTRDGQIDCDVASGSSCRFGRQKPVVVIPTVLKGLNNQRMRLVSDIVGAILIGAAVQLPSMLAT